MIIMHKQYKLVLVLLFLFVNILFANGIDLTAQEKEYLKNKKEITVCVKKDWLPYESFKDGRFVGISADFLNLYTKKLNISLKIIKSKDYLENKKFLEEGRCDIKPIMPNNINSNSLPYKATYLNFSDSIALVTRTKQLHIENLNYLNNKKIVVIKQFAKIKNFIKKNYPNIIWQEVNDIDTALKLVASKKVFGYIGTSLVSSYYIQKRYSTKLKIANSFKNLKFGFGVVDSEPLLLSILNKTINTTSKIQKKDIFFKWLSKDAGKEFDKTEFYQLLGVFIIILSIIIYFLIKQNKLKKLIEKQYNDLNLSNKKLFRVKERLSLAMDGTNDGLFDWNIVSNEIYFSPRWKEMLGYKDNEIANKFEEWEKRVHPDDLNNTLQTIQKNIDTKVPLFETIHRLKHKNGSWVWILSRGKIYFNENMTPFRMVGTHTDITKEKYLEQKLFKLNNTLQTKVSQQVKEITKSNQLFKTIFNTVKEGIVIVDFRYNLLLTNKAYEDITGFTKNEFCCEKGVTCCTASKTITSLQKEFKIAKEKGYYGGVKKTITSKNGKIIDIKMYISLMPDNNNKFLVVIKDITQENIYKRKKIKQKEQILIQSRQAQMGEMISMIAHQWRQPLTAISSAIIGLKLQIDSGKIDFDQKDEIEKYLANIDKKYNKISGYVQFLSDTIDDFRNFIKPNKEKETVNITTPIEEALAIVEVSMKNNNIKIIKEYKIDKKLFLFKNEIMQVILNILKNSEDNFIEKKISNRQINISTKKYRNDYLISIKDNGGGIEENIINKIFDPYFSTKDEKNGTGLGLYMSKVIIKKHNNGRLSVKNTKDGVCFKIVLKDKKDV